MKPKPIRIVFAVTNDLSTDQRMHRICGTMQDAGFEVCLVGRKKPGMLPLAGLHFKTVRLSIPFQKGFPFYAAYNIRLFFFLFFKPADAFVACDLDTLPANWLAATVRRKKLLFDAHEIFTEVPELVHRPFVQKFWLKLEQFLLPRVHAAITVNESLAAFYYEKYHIRMSVIRNVPQRKADQAESIRPGWKEFFNDKKVILYQGSVNIGRGLELVIEAMPSIREAVFVIAGDGDILQQLREKVEKLGLEKRVLFCGRLSPADLRSLTHHAHIGISLEENRGLNYYYSSPNKVYDYIQAEVPVLVSPFPEMMAIVDKYTIGEILEERNAAFLAEKVNTMLHNQEQYAVWKENLARAAADYNWENEVPRLLYFFQNAGLKN